MNTRVAERSPVTLPIPGGAEQLAMYGDTGDYAAKAPLSASKVPATKAPTGAANATLDAPGEIRKNLTVALTQLSAGKVQSLEQFKTYTGADRPQIEARLNQEVKRASGGQVQTYQALLEKGQTQGTPGKKGYNPLAAVTYAATGMAVAYNLMVTGGLTPRDAAMKLPGSFSRGFITASIAQAPTNIKDPYLQVAFKGGVGAVLTLGTNAVAGKINPRAALPPALNGGMVVAAFTTAGAVVGLQQLQQNGYLGGPPPTNPKDWKEWFGKYAPPSAAISLGLLFPVVGSSVLNSIKSGRALTPGQIAVNAVATLVLPFVQNLLANAIVNPPKDAALDPSKFPPGTADKLKAAANLFSQAGLYVVSDKIWDVVSKFGKPPPAAGTAAAQWSLKASVGMAAWATAIGEAANVLGTGVSLIGRDTKDIHQARQALAEIDKLLRHPFTYLSNPNPALSPYEAINPRDERIEGLKLAREEIYKQHPELRPRNATPGR
jgi:hypothetical protein